jgi:type II secretory pathway pseudopilin PulG
LIELLVVIAIIALLIGLLLPALATAQRNARTGKDKANQKEIHQAALVFANENKGKLPIPGLINRLPDEYQGINLPGMGKEDFTVNSSDNLYSAMIAQNYYAPDLLIGPTEANPSVQQYLNYDYSAYSPTDDTYWDANFNADIEDGVSHTSYAHMALCGQRKKIKWRDTQASGDVILATRGTREGAQQGTEYIDSPTLLLHGPKRQWVGNVAFNDNHVDNFDNFYPSPTTYEPLNENESKKDNIFAAEFSDYAEKAEGSNVGHASGDAYTILCGSPTTEFSVEPQWDTLLNN